MGIILFNYNNLKVLYNIEGEPGFRPLMGIILFNILLLSHVVTKYMTCKFPSPNGDYFI